MQIKVNIEKRHAFMIFGAILLLAAAIGISAYGEGNPSFVGHKSNDIDFSSGISQDLTLTGDLQVTGNILENGVELCMKNGSQCFNPVLSCSAKVVRESTYEVKAKCPSGSVLTGGSCVFTDPSFSNYIKTSTVDPSNSRTWLCRPKSGGNVIEATAICCTIQKESGTTD